MSVFGDWVRRTRKSKGYTQKECADRAGMQYQNWSRWERGGRQTDTADDPQPERDTVLAFAHGLQVPDEEALLAAGYAPATKTLTIHIDHTDSTLPRPSVEEMRENVRKAMEILGGVLEELEQVSPK